MIDAARLEHDCDGTVEQWFLVLEDDFGSHKFEVDPVMVLAALKPWIHSQIEGEMVRREYVASGGKSWDEYRRSQERLDPDWADQLREAGDHFRKVARESGARLVPIVDRDPGDETDVAA